MPSEAIRSRPARMSAGTTWVGDVGAGVSDRVAVALDVAFGEGVDVSAMAVDAALGVALGVGEDVAASSGGRFVEQATASPTSSATGSQATRNHIGIA